MQCKRIVLILLGAIRAFGRLSLNETSSLFSSLFIPHRGLIQFKQAPAQPKKIPTTPKKTFQVRSVVPRVMSQQMHLNIVGDGDSDTIRSGTFWWVLWWVLLFWSSHKSMVIFWVLFIVIKCDGNENFGFFLRCIQICWIISSVKEKQ